MGSAQYKRILVVFGGEIRAGLGGSQYRGVTFQFTLKKTGLAQEMETGIRS